MCLVTFCHTSCGISCTLECSILALLLLNVCLCVPLLHQWDSAGSYAFIYCAFYWPEEPFSATCSGCACERWSCIVWAAVPARQKKNRNVGFSNVEENTEDPYSDSEKQASDKIYCKSHPAGRAAYYYHSSWQTKAARLPLLQAGFRLAFSFVHKVVGWR